MPVGLQRQPASLTLSPHATAAFHIRSASRPRAAGKPSQRIVPTPDNLVYKSGAMIAPHEIERARLDRIMLVCSPGGHLMQLLQLRHAWSGRNPLWVTLDKSDARSLLAAEAVVYAFGPTSRNIPNLLRNLRLAWRLVRLVRPAILITTGAGLAVPFAWVARLHGAYVVYVESIARIERPSLSYRLIEPAAQRLYAQWPDLAQRERRARYRGSVFATQ